MVENNKVMEKIQIKCSEDMSVKKYGFGIRHVQMICMCICMIALFIARSSLGVAILAMTDLTRLNDTNIEIYEWDKKTQGLILSSFFWGYTIMQIPAGILAKNYGGKLILLVALLANAVICAILPTVASYGGWIMVCMCRVAMGLTQACLFPASHTLLGKWLPARERTALTGLVYGGSQIGTIIAMPVSGVLAETAIGWKLIFYSVSGLMVVTAGIWYWFSASTPAEHKLLTQEEREYIEMELNSTSSKDSPPVPWRELFRTVPLWALTITHCGTAMAFNLFFVDLPTYLERAMQISLKNSASLSALPFVGMWIGSVFSSNLCERIYNRGLLSLTACRKIFNSFALFGVGAGLIFLAFLGVEQKSLAVMTVVGTLTMYGFISAGFMVNHLDLSPQFAGVMLSLTNFVASLGSILTPVGTGLLLRNNPADVSRWKVVFIVTAGIVIGVNIVYLVFGSTERQHWDRPDFQDRRKAKQDEVTPLSKKQEKEREANKSV